ncbi:DNA phosphorothioation-dependent restriction protein DptF [Clostridium paraputrificum]|uniref:DNA phosphorothioation-dependent restriction protein DptF n=1 Tax=Clostridium paraputrificum TaxID=29363 RepID=UPI0034A55EC0
MQDNVFSYLDKEYKYLREYVIEIDESLFVSTNNAILKGRVFAEKLSQEVAKLEELDDLIKLTQNDRLRELKYRADIDSEILDCFHEIRKTGNIAAHSDLEGELEAALRIHRNIYKITCWFVQTYIDYRFEPLPYKNPKPKLESGHDHLIEQLINKVDSLANITQEKHEKDNFISEQDNIEEIAAARSFEHPITIENKECLIQEISKLKESSKEAVEALNKFSDFKKYMHITRDAQIELEGLILDAYEQTGSQLILVCGSVGDGKSHIISYFKNKYPEKMASFVLQNDATESLAPDKTSMDTLNEVLENFSDEKIDSSNEKCILAINLGTLNNFIDSEYGERFTILKKFVAEKKILETTIEDNSFNSDGHIQFVNFSDYHLFTLKDGQVKSNYIKSLIKKITDPSEVNTFYSSYKENCSKCSYKGCCPIKANYEFLSEDGVQDAIVDLLVQCIIKKKIIISTRALLNFIYDLVVARTYIDVNSPTFKSKIGNLKNEDYINSLTPNIIFSHKELSFIFEALNSLDPLNVRNERVDDFIIKFNNTVEVLDFFNEYIDFPKGYLNKVIDLDFSGQEGKKVKSHILKLFIRSYYLCGKGDIFSLKDEVYEKFISNLYFWNKGEKSKLKSLYSEIKDGIIKWNGDTDKNHINIFVGKKQLQYKVSEELELKADISKLPSSNEAELVKFLTSLELNFKTEKLNKSVGIDIDFSLYDLLVKVTKGYRPNKKDKNHFIKFIEFINKLESTGSQSEKLVFTQKNREENKKFRLEYDDEFEIYKFMEI